MTKFRCSDHDLMVETGRHKNEYVKCVPLFALKMKIDLILFQGVSSTV